MGSNNQLEEKKKMLQEIISLVDKAVTENSIVVSVIITGGAMMQRSGIPIATEAMDGKYTISFDVNEALVLNTRFKRSNAVHVDPSYIKEIEKSFLDEDTPMYKIVYDTFQIVIYVP